MYVAGGAQYIGGGVFRPAGGGTGICYFKGAKCCILVHFRRHFSFIYGYILAQNCLSGKIYEGLRENIQGFITDMTFKSQTTDNRLKRSKRLNHVSICNRYLVKPKPFNTCNSKFWDGVGAGGVIDTMQRFLKCLLLICVFSSIVCIVYNLHYPWTTYKYTKHNYMASIVSWMRERQS